jgi:hypothetical protein
VGGCLRSLECLEQSATMPDESVLLDLRQDDTVRRCSAALRQLNPPDTQSGRGRQEVRVSGQWSLVSGYELADWIPVMSGLTEGTETRMRAPGVPESRMAYVPKGAYRIVDTWYVGGLRGTGSHDVVVDNVFVPAEQSCSLMDWINSISPCRGCRCLPPWRRGALPSVWGSR